MADAMNYNVENPDGTTHTIGNEGLVQHLQGQGYQAVGATADGNKIIMQEGKNTYHVPVEKILDRMGYKLNEKVPANANYDNIQPEWRAAVTSMGGDDDWKKSYIESKLKRGGDENPKVMGSGRNWYVYHPETSTWLGVTNHPGEWGLPDLAEAGTEGLRVLGVAAGGGFGSPGGPLGIAAGSAGGGALAGALERSAFKEFDPDYDETMTRGRNLDAMMAPAASDAVGGLGGKALQEVAPGLLKAPVSNAAKGIGWMGEKGGAAVSGLADMLKTASKPAASLAEEQTTREAAKSLLSEGAKFAVMDPVTASIEGAGQLSQIPKAAAEGTHKFLTNVAGGAEEETPEFINRLIKPRAPSAPTWTERAASRMGGKPAIAAPSKTVDLFGNAGEMLGDKLGRIGKPGAEEAANTEFGKILERTPELRDMPPEIAAKVKAEMAEGFRNASEEGVSDWAAKGGRAGESLGRGVENMAKAGETGVKAATGIWNTQMGLGGMAGKAMQGAGSALQGAGNLAAPLELPAYMQEAANQARLKWLRQKHGGSTIKSKPPAHADEI